MAALDAPEKHLEDIIRLLLIVGADQSIQSNKGLTARDIATQNSNQKALEVLDEFQRAANDPSLQDKYLDIVNELRRREAQGPKKPRYSFQLDARIYRRDVEKWDAEFSLPEFLFDRERVGYIPKELMIHEHQIRPLIEEGFDIQNVNKQSEEYLLTREINASLDPAASSKSSTVEAMKCLDFARDQAMRNRERRIHLLNESAPEWSSPQQVEEALKMNKY